MTLESSKNLGGIGAILLIVASVAFFIQPLFSFIGIVGVILILMALQGLAEVYRDRSIFNNALMAFIAIIVGVTVTVIGLYYLFFATAYVTDLVKVIYPGFNGDWTNLPNLTPNTNANPNDIIPFIGPILSILAGTWVFSIITSVFAWRSLKSVAAKSTIGMFATSGILMLIGSILLIAFGLGAILMWIATLLLAIAFFQLKPYAEPAAASTAAPAPSSPSYT
jgi:uncharacterized membrane protein